jgi:hypothetical protein
MKDLIHKKEYQKEWVKNNTDKARANYRRYYYNNRDVVIERMAKRKQNNKIKLAGRPASPFCEVCGKVCKTIFDHDHKTGKFRGWLCHQCNTALGLAQENPVILEALKNYVIAHWARNEVEKQGYKLVIGDKGKVVKIISPYQLSNVPLQ